MSLRAGDTLGPYEIVEPIGRGGMGEVYRARDPRLHRDVAIKVSTARFSQRFEREARAIAALNHPNVCTLYDVGPDYLVMELVEGVTLADSLITGPLPQQEALTIARQIAEALEAAHEHGIVHRDLKPANVKIRPDGKVKVLDLGLAKQAQSFDVDETATIVTALYVSRDEVPQRTTRFTVPIPGDDPETARFELSPNGRLLAITAIEKGRRGLWVRPLDSLEARLIAGTDGAEWPFWSADSTQIEFFASSRLMRVPVTGGTPVPVAQIGPLSSGASWNADDVIVFASTSVSAAQAVSHVRATGGTITPIRFEGLDNGALPRFLPDGRRFLFRANRPKEAESGIWVGSLDHSQVQLVSADFTNVAYVPGPDRRGPVGCCPHAPSL